MQREQDSRAAETATQPEFDKFAADYRRVHAENIAASGEAPEYFAAYKMRDFAALVARHGIDQRGTFLDFGSGIGASVRPFGQLLPEARLICADVSLESLRHSQELHGAGPTYIPVLAGRLELQSGSVDAAFACCVFHHVPELEQEGLLYELRRVLKPGGLLMIYEHNPLNPLTVRAVNSCPLDENAVLIAARDMKRRCASAGFRALETNYRVFFPAALRKLRYAESALRWLPLGAQYCLSGRA